MRGLRCGISTDSLTPRIEVVFVINRPHLREFCVFDFSSIYWEKRGFVGCLSSFCSRNSARFEFSKEVLNIFRRLLPCPSKLFRKAFMVTHVLFNSVIHSSNVSGNIGLSCIHQMQSFGCIAVCMQVMFFSRAQVLLTFRDISLLRDRGLSCFSCVLTLLVSYANAVSPANDDVSTSPRTYLHTHLPMRSMYKVCIWMYMNIHRFLHVLNITCKLHEIHVMSMGLTCKELSYM